MPTGTRVYARIAIHYDGAPVVHKGGRGTVVHAIGAATYVRWDWTGDTYPTDRRLIRELG